MPARDPNKLEPAYLITLAVIVLFPFCCSYLTRSSATPPTKMTVPAQGAWSVITDDSETGCTATQVAIRDRKWRVEVGNPENSERTVVVHDGQRTVSQPPDFAPGQLELLDPVKMLGAVAMVYDRHPRPESVALDGVLCWHAKVKEGNDECEVWLDAKTGFPKKFIAARGSGRVRAYAFEKFSPTAPSNSRLFEADALTPMLGQ